MLDWFKNLKLKTKLILSNLLLIFLIASLAFVAIYKLNKIDQDFRSMDMEFESLGTLLKADSDLYQVVAAERKMIFSKPKSEQFKAFVLEHEQALVSSSNRIQHFRERLQNEPAIKLLEQYQSSWLEWKSLTEKIKDARMADTRAGRSTAIDLSFGSSAEKFDQMRLLLKKMIADVEARSVEISGISSARVKNALEVIIFLLIISITLALVISIILPKLIVNPVIKMTELITRLAEGEGDLKQKLNIEQNDEIGKLGKAINQMQNSIEKQMVEERDIAAENSRIKQALDNVSAKVLVTDKDSNIVYINNALTKLFKDSERDISQNLAGFNLNSLMSSNINVFSHNETFKKAIVSDLSKPSNAEINLGNKIFTIVANPILSENNHQLGTVLEWADLTEQREAERQIEKVITAVVSGQLNNRLDGTSFEGFLKTISHDINKLLDTIVKPLNMAASYVEQIARGQIPEPITEPYEGDFNQIKNNLNTCIEAINLLISDAASLSHAAVDGKLSIRADASQHQGAFHEIVAGVNQTLDAIVLPIKEYKEVMNSLANGDLTNQVKGDYQGEFLVMKESVNLSINNLLHLVSKISEASGFIQTSALEVNSGNIDISSRTESQASALQETTATLQQLTNTVMQNTQNAQDANNLANSTSIQAQNGGEVVSQVITSVKEISDSSNKIANIIGVIDEIAFQTNLLALNAAVEAARAGDQGRGFAVVAGEVRNLAQRSSSAAKDIKGLIQESVTKVQEGNDLVIKSGQTLAEIVASVKKVAEIISNIANGSQSQATGIVEVNKAIDQIDQMTQSNSAIVEEVTAASTSVSKQAVSLANLINQFKVS